jgi:chaperonin GroES
MTKRIYNVKPLYDRVLVQRVVIENPTTEGGIILATDATPCPNEYVVRAVGPGIIKEDGSLKPMNVKVGDHIILGATPGTLIGLASESVGGKREPLRIVREVDILAVFEVVSPDANVNMDDPEDF